MSGFLELAQALNIPWRTAGTHARPGWIQIDCPFCGPYTGKFHMGYSVTGGVFNCWRCGSHTVWETLSCLTNLPVGQLIAKYELGRGLPKTASVGAQGVFRTPFKIFPLALPEAYRAFLRARGFSCPEQTCMMWQAAAIDEYFGKWAYRLYMPMFDNVRRGGPVTYTSRTIGESTPKYLNAANEDSEIPPKSLLYGEQNVRTSLGVPCGHIIVVEGPLDAWKIGPGAVATLGVQFTPAQVARLATYQHVTILYDTDEAGVKAAEKLTSQLYLACNVSVAHMDEGAKDPGGLSEHEAKELRKEVFSL